MAEPNFIFPAKLEVFEFHSGLGFHRFSSILVIFCHFCHFLVRFFFLVFTIPTVKLGMNEFRGFMLFGAPKIPQNSNPG